MKQDWREIKITDILFILSVILICLICCSAMSFLMPYRIYMIGIFGIFMYMIAFMKNKYLILNPISIMMELFVILSFSGVLYTLARTETMKYSLIYLCLLPIMIFDTESQFYSKVLVGFKIITFIVACTIILNAAIPNLFLNTLNFLIKPGLKSWIQAEVSGKLYSGMAGEKGEAAMLMVVGMAIAVSEFIRKSKITVKDALYTGVIAFALVLPAKRMLFVIGIFFIVVYILFWTKKDKKMLAIAFGAIIAIFVIVFAEYIPGMNVLLARFIDGQGDESLNGRSYLWERALQMFHNKPILGYGYGSYNTFASFYGVKTSATGDWAFHAHNVYLQLLAEMGIVGACFMFGTIIYSGVMTIVLHIKRSVMHSDDMAMLAFTECMQICFIVYDFTGNSLYSTNQMALYMFTFAIVVYLVRKTRKRGEIIEK